MVVQTTGMLVHPAGDQFVWALIGLVRAAPNDEWIWFINRSLRPLGIALTKTAAIPLKSN